MPVSTPVVVAGDLITAAGWNQIRADLLGLQTERGGLGPHHLRYVPGGPLDGVAGAWVTWMTAGSFTIPAYATAVIAQVNICGILATTIGEPQYLLRCATSSNTEVNAPGIMTLPPSITERTNVSFVSYLQSPAAGVFSLQIQVSRTNGTGTCRADVGTIVTTHIQMRA